MERIHEIINTIKNRIDLNNISSVLDLGCGAFISREKIYPYHDMLSIFNDKIIKCIDIFEDNILWRQKHGPIGDYECMNILDYKFKEKYDVIICHHVLEHLKQEEHDIIFEKIDNSDCKYIILGGPIGESDNDSWVLKTKNSYEKHLIGLNPLFYENKGYEINLYDNAFLAIKEKNNK